MSAMLSSTYPPISSWQDWVRASGWAELWLLLASLGAVWQRWKQHGATSKDFFYSTANIWADPACKPPPPASWNCDCGHVARYGLLSYLILSAIPDRQTYRAVLHCCSSFGSSRRASVCWFPEDGWPRRVGRIPVDVFTLWLGGCYCWFQPPMVASRSTFSSRRSRSSKRVSQVVSTAATCINWGGRPHPLWGLDQSLPPSHMEPDWCLACSDWLATVALDSDVFRSRWCRYWRPELRYGDHKCSKSWVNKRTTQLTVRTYLDCKFITGPSRLRDHTNDTDQMDLIAILLVTPISDRFHHHRALFFSVPVCIQIAGLLLTTYGTTPWPRYGGLLLVGFGLGPTVPITMTWTSQIFQHRHGEVGVAAASALVSGLGNLGSILTTYALFTGWISDSKPGRKKYRKSTLVMVGILCLSIVSAFVMALLLRYIGNRPSAKQISSGSSTSESEGVIEDGAAKRELQERGLGRLWWRRWRSMHKKVNTLSVTRPCSDSQICQGV